jgi:tRNA dimethylallyltransferase
MKKKYLVVIQGPTAVGKTSLSIDLAKSLNAEILSSDSRQFYQELRIGVARPSPQELAKVKHHFIAHLSIHDYYSVSHYEQDVLQLLKSYFLTKDVALLVGGSGMYSDVVCNGIDHLPDPDEKLRLRLNEKWQKEGLESIRNELKIRDPEFYEMIDLNNPKRVLRALEVCMQTGKKYSQLRSQPKRKREFEIIKIGLRLPREILVERIHRRVDMMMKEGLLDEVKQMFEWKDLNALNTVGYKELFAYLQGAWTLDFAIGKIKTNTRRFSKRQMTWYRKDAEIRWFEADRKQEILNYLEQKIDR